MIDATRPLFAFVRINRIRTLNYLRMQERHARREAPTAETRPGVTRGTCIHWSRYGSRKDDYVRDYQRLKAEVGARERAGAALGLHLLVGVSSAWFSEFGDPNDPYNPRLVEAFKEVKIWAEGHFGGLYAARMDLDERGSGVVDVFVMPSHMRQGRPRGDGTRGSGVCEISVKSALESLQRTAGGGPSFGAAQTLWARHAHDHLDSRIVRGTPKTNTWRQHLSVAEFRQSVEEHKAVEQQREGSLVTLQNTLKVWLEVDAAQRERAAALIADEATLRDRRDALTFREEQLEDEKQHHEVDRDADLRRLADLRAELESRQRQQDDRDRAYSDWSIERAAYESDYSVRLSMIMTAESEATVRVEREAVNLARAQQVFADRSARENNALATRLASLSAAEDDHLARSAEKEVSFARREHRLQAEQRDVRERERKALALHGLAERDASAAAVAAGQLRDDRAELTLERADLERQRVEMDRRTYEIGALGERFDRRGVELDRRDVALRSGLQAIEFGSIRSENDVLARPDLQPAGALLAHILRSVERRATAVAEPVQLELARRGALMVARDKHLTTREQGLMAMERALEARRSALQAGVDAIESGAVRTSADLDAVPGMKPARSLLVQITRAMESAVDRETLEARTAGLRAKQAAAGAEAEASAAAQARQAAEADQREAARLKGDAIARARAANGLLRAARTVNETCRPLVHRLPNDVQGVLQALEAARQGWANFKGIDPKTPGR